jgi:hypothetical protein
MTRRYDHIDLRVHSLAEAGPFYEALLPPLGFTRRVTVEGWLQFESIQPAGPADFFGITETPLHRANGCRIAFWAESTADVDRLGNLRPKKDGRLGVLPRQPSDRTPL